MNPHLLALTQGELQSQLLGLLDESDLRVDTYRGQGGGETPPGTHLLAVRVTHVPTGFAETCNDYQTQIENQLVALARLANRVFKPE